MRLSFLFAPLLLSGCFFSFGGDASRSIGLDPLRLDPTQVAVRLTLPEGAAVVADSAILTIGARNLGTGGMNEQSYLLDDSNGVFRIAAEDVPRLLAQQSLLREWEAGPGIDGEMSADIQSCAIGAGPALDAMMAVAIQTEPGGTFFPLASAPLQETAGGSALAPC